MDSTCIVCCDSLLSHLEAAQVKMGTKYPIYTLDRALHSQPKNMRQSLLDEYDSVWVEKKGTIRAEKGDTVTMYDYYLDEES